MNSVVKYFAFRRALFADDIKLWLKQFEHLLLVSIMFLGTALPALFYALLLAFGIVFNFDIQAAQTTTSSLMVDNLQQTLFIIWCIFTVQCILLMLARDAIVGTRYGLFLASINIQPSLKYVIDILFLNIRVPLW